VPPFHDNYVLLITKDTDIIVLETTFVSRITTRPRSF